MGCAIIIVGGVGVAILGADDATGFGVADDVLIAPLIGVMGKGAEIVQQAFSVAPAIG